MMSASTSASPSAIAREKILAQDQGRLHKARASVVSLGEILSGEGMGTSEEPREAMPVSAAGLGGTDVDHDNLRALTSEKVNDKGVESGRAIAEEMQSVPSPAASSESPQLDQFVQSSPPTKGVHYSPFQQHHDTPQDSDTKFGDHDTGRDGAGSPMSSAKILSDRSRDSFEPLIPTRTSSVPPVNSSRGTTTTSLSRKMAKPVRPKAKMPQSASSGSGHSHSRSFQHLLSRSRSNSGSETEDPASARGKTNAGPTGATLGLSLTALRSSMGGGGGGGVTDSVEEEQITSLPPVPATLTDMDPEKKKVLIRRARKLEKVLGEALSESEVGELVVDPTRHRSAGERARQGEAGRMPDEMAGLIFPPARGIEDAGPQRDRGQDAARAHSHAPEGAHKFRPRVSSEPELSSPTTGSFDPGADLIARPKSSLDFTDSGSDNTFSSTGPYRFYDHDTEDMVICVDDTGAGPGAWLKRVGSKLGGQIASNPQRLGRLGRGGSASSQKAIDKDLRDNGVRVLVKQEKITVRTSYLDPSWLPSRPTQNRRASGMNAAARLAELKALRRHSSPISPTFGVGFIEQAQSFGGMSQAQGLENVNSLAGLLSEDERRVKRAQLAKLHRLLGTRVPVELLLNSVGSAPTQDERYNSVPLQPLQTVQSTLQAIPGLYEDVPMTPEEKARAVKRASKMISKFGTAPPVAMYLPDKTAGDQPGQDPPTDRAVAYRQSLISLKYLLDNDENSLNDVLSDLMEESEEDTDGRSSLSRASIMPPNVLRRVSSTPSIRPSNDSSSHPNSTPTPPSPMSPEPAKPDDFVLRRKRAGKISKFFGEDNLGSQHLQEHVVPAEATRQSFGSKRSIMLDRVLEEIERGAEADQAQGLLDDGELNDVKEHVYALRKSASLKKLGGSSGSSA